MSQPTQKANAGGKALIALGSNATSDFGDPLQTVKKALSTLGEGPINVLAQSRLYHTPCFPAGAGPDYVNAVILGKTALDPGAVLDWLHGIEQKFDRVRTARWASRTLDLDLLTMDQVVLPDQSTLREWVNLPRSRQGEIAPDRLILPHPRLQDRAFVLVPAAEVAPDWRHPLLGHTIAEMRDALPPEDLAAVVPIDAC